MPFLTLFAHMGHMSSGMKLALRDRPKIHVLLNQYKSGNQIPKEKKRKKIVVKWSSFVRKLP